MLPQVLTCLPHATHIHSKHKHTTRASAVATLVTKYIYIIVIMYVIYALVSLRPLCVIVTVLWCPVVPLTVTIDDREISARVGEGVELVCMGEGSGVTVEWWRGSTSLGKGLVTSEKQDHLLSKYQIDSVTQRDTGEYVCRVTSPYFPDPLEDKATVTVLGKGYTILSGGHYLR